MSQTARDGFVLFYSDSYSFWSSSDGTYLAMSDSGHCKIRHKSFSVVVLVGLFLRSLSMVELDI